MTRNYFRGALTPRRILIAGLVLLVLGLAAQLWILPELRVAVQAMRSGGATFKRPQIPSEETVVIVLALLAIPGMGVALAGFFLGLARIRRAAERAGLTGYAHSFGWTVGSFFIPGLNLYRPWVGLGEIRRSVFASLETKRLGKKWNRYGDVSVATIGFAAGAVALASAQLAYNVFAPSIWVTLGGPVQVYALIDNIRTHAVANMALLSMQMPLFFVYLATLQGPSQQLSALSAEGALAVA
jgi:hypothetical protein